MINTKTDARQLNFIKRVKRLIENEIDPEIFFKQYDHSFLVKFHKQYKIGLYPTLERLLKMNKSFNYDLFKFTFDDAITLMIKLKERTVRLRSEGKHQQIIDLQLYMLFSKTEEDARRVYGEMIENKVKNWEPASRDCNSHEYFVRKYGEENAVYEKEQKHIRQRVNRNTRIEYYLAKGFSIEDAKLAVKERQTTFSLEKCIEKYGKVEGEKRWLERQHVWQSTLKRKPQQEKDKINARKQQNVETRFLTDEPAIFYIIRIAEQNHFKIGITKKESIYRRYKKRDLDKHEIIKEFRQSAKCVFCVENIFKCGHENFIISSDEHTYKIFGRQETFKNLSEEYIVNTVTNLFDLFLES